MKPTVADGVGRPILVNRILKPAACVKKDVVEDELANGWVRLHLDIDSGTVQSI